MQIHNADSHIQACRLTHTHTDSHIQIYTHIDSHIQIYTYMQIHTHMHKHTYGFTHNIFLNNRESSVMLVIQNLGGLNTRILRLKPACTTGLGLVSRKEER